MNKQHWQDWVNLFLGLWVIASPWTIAHVMAGPENTAGVTGAAMWNYYMIGIGVALLAGLALFAFNPWEEWVNLALGAWLLVSPWLLGFSTSASLMWNAVIVGLLIVGFAWWTIAEEQRPATK